VSVDKETSTLKKPARAWQHGGHRAHALDTGFAPPEPVQNARSQAPDGGLVEADVAIDLVAASVGADRPAFFQPVAQEVGVVNVGPEAVVVTLPGSAVDRIAPAVSVWAL